MVDGGREDDEAGIISHDAKISLSSLLSTPPSLPSSLSLLFVLCFMNILAKLINSQHLKFCV